MNNSILVFLFKGMISLSFMRISTRKIIHSCDEMALLVSPNQLTLLFDRDSGGVVCPARSHDLLNGNCKFEKT